MSLFISHGDGKFKLKDFKKIGQNVIFEPGVLVFHPENIEIGSNVYIGHNTILKAYHKNKMVIADNVWIGQNCFFHSAGGIFIKEKVGIGPGVQILTSPHDLDQDNLGPITDLPLKYLPVVVDEGSDIGMGAILMPGVTIACGTQVGAGAVVTKNTRRFAIVAGVPARQISIRKSASESGKQIKNNFLTIFVVGFLKYLFDILFVPFYLIIILYSWFRYLIKKIFKLYPKILVSPLGSPLPFFIVKAIRTQKIQVQGIALECPEIFRKVAGDCMIVSDKRLLNRLNIISDYLLLFSWSLLKYDLYEFPFSGGLLMHSHYRKIEYLLLKICAKKISVYGYGSDCKILSEIRSMGFKYNNAMDRAEETESRSEKFIQENVQRAQKFGGALIAGGDLIHFGKKGLMLPLPVDLSYWQKSGMPQNKVITLVHSTNHRSHKGSRFILEVVEKLSQKLPIKMMLVEKKTIEECQKLYPKGDIFIPDVISGWHGMTAIEAMAAGRPVITYLRPDIARYHAYYARKIPVMNANPDNLAQAITKLARTPQLRKKLGQEGWEYVHKFHSLEFGGALRKIIYDYLWDDKMINQRIFEYEIKKRKLIS